MSIILIEQPGSAPTSLAEWTKVVETDKFYNLGISNPVDYEFTGNTVKSGVQINIGGSNYQVIANEAITGTPSDIVKITPSGSTATASYVPDLTGVNWNNVYDFYADVSGNAYLFDEAKQVAAGNIATPKKLVGKYSELTYAKKSIIGSIIDSDVTLKVVKTEGALPTIASTTVALFQRNSSDASSCDITLIAGITGQSRINLGDTTNEDVGQVAYNHSTEQMTFTTGGSIGMRLTLNKNLLINTSIDSDVKLKVVESEGSLPSLSTLTVGLFQRNSTSAESCSITIIAGVTGQSAINLGDTTNEDVGQIVYNHSSNYMGFVVGGSEGARLTLNKNFLINTLVDSDVKLKVVEAEGSLPSISTSTVGLFQRNSTSAESCDIVIIAGQTGISRVNFGDTTNENTGQIAYNHSTEQMTVRVANAQKIIIKSTEIDFSININPTTTPTESTVSRISVGSTNIPRGHYTIELEVQVIASGVTNPIVNVEQLINGTWYVIDTVTRGLVGTDTSFSGVGFRSSGSDLRLNITAGSNDYIGRVNLRKY